MRGSSRRVRWAGLLTAAVVAVGFGGNAAAEQQRGGGPTIQMVEQNGELDFTGPTSVAQGQTLRIVNNTDPQQVGPHTFTLVKKGRKPYARIIRAHEVDQNGNVGRRTVDSGRTGWNRVFTFQHRGDSWYVDEEDKSQTRVVSAAAGRTIRYFCAIHPFMKGQFDVVGP